MSTFVPAVYITKTHYLKRLVRVAKANTEKLVHGVFSPIRSLLLRGGLRIKSPLATTLCVILTVGRSPACWAWKHKSCYVDPRQDSLG